MIRVSMLALVSCILGSASAAMAEPGPATSSPSPARAVPGKKPDAVIQLWPEGTPNLVAGGKAEEFINERYRNVSEPQLLVYLPRPEKAKGTALIICAGGGYAHLSMCLHVDPVVKLLNEEGIAVFGLKYRTNYGGNNVPADALADGQRAVRIVRSRAAEWGLNPQRIGVQGYSAGSNLCLNLAGHFDEGQAASVDAIERVSSRPDFCVLMCPWPNGKKVEDYPLGKDAPPTFIASARDDTTAPLAFAMGIDEKLKGLGVVEEMWVVETGGHSAFHFGTTTGPGAKWPEAVLPWLRKVGMLK